MGANGSCSTPPLTCVSKSTTRRELHPAPDGGPRNSPIKAVVLTNGDVDAVAGLLCLREGQPLTVYGTARVLGVLASNSIFDVLDPNVVKRSHHDVRAAIRGRGSVRSRSGITIEAFPVPGKVPLYLEDAEAGTGFGTQEGDTVGPESDRDAQAGGTSSSSRAAPSSTMRCARGSKGRRCSSSTARSTPMTR